jgi:hypothetical protein
LFVEISDHLKPFVHERALAPESDLISRLSRQEADGAAVTFERLHTMANVSPIADLDTAASSRETLCSTDVAIDRVRRQLLSMLDRLDKGEPVDSGLARYTCEPK